jgi:hypothetical protein
MQSTKTQCSKQHRHWLGDTKCPAGHLTLKTVKVRRLYFPSYLWYLGCRSLGACDVSRLFF